MKQLKTNTLKPYEKNAKKHPKKQVQQVADSIKEFGFNQPIVADKDNVIIVGHGRWMAAQLLGLETVPVINVDLTEEQAKAYRLADNKLNESDWDMDLVLPELKELSQELFDITGFNSDLLIDVDDKDDEIPEVPAEPQSKLGDLYELGAHRVLCGSATETSDVERLMGSHKADMVFTDPPYGMDFKGSVNGDGSRSANSKLKQIGNETGSEVDKIEFINKWLPIVTSLTNRAWYICYSRHNLKNLLVAMDENKVPLRNLIIWNKNRQNMSNSDYKSKYELILYGWKERAWFGSMGDNDVWDIQKLNKVELHPTQKPIELVQKAILNSSVSGELVVDLFAGCGTTLIASEKTGRICYSMELEPVFVDVVVQRYVDYTGNTKIVKNGKPIQWKKSA